MIPPSEPPNLGGLGDPRHSPLVDHKMVVLWYLKSPNTDLKLQLMMTFDQIGFMQSHARRSVKKGKLLKFD